MIDQPADQPLFTPLNPTRSLLANGERENLAHTMSLTDPNTTTRLHYNPTADSRHHGYDFETSSSSSSRVRSDSLVNGKGATTSTRSSPLEYHRSDLDQSRVLSTHQKALASVRQDDSGHDLPRLPLKKAPQPVDIYPTPPPSPDLLELDIVPTPPKVTSPLVSYASTIGEGSTNIIETDWNSFPTDNNNKTDITHHNNEYDKSRSSSPNPNTSIRYKRTPPPIPISLSLNTTHSLPHAAPFKLAHAAGILSALGGNRVLQVDRKASIFDRMPYSPASTNGLMLTQDQGEEASVEAMLEGASTPMSPDQSYVFTHPCHRVLFHSRLHTCHVPPLLLYLSYYVYQTPYRALRRVF